jgi:hypothetical protein
VIRALIGVAAVVLVVVIVWALLVPGPDWLATHDISSAKGSLAAARDAARGRLLTLGAGLLAAGALLFTARNFTLSREGQVTDRYTKAIEQLGSEKLDVRIGGIYALERIARDSAKDHPTVMEVLTAFIREHSHEPWPPPETGSSGRTAAAPRALSSTTRTQRPARTVQYLAARSSSSTSNPPEPERVTRPDVRAAATVIGRRNAKRDIRPIDLARVDLTRADLTDANLNLANLNGAHLTGADFTRAALVGAYLYDADLDGAHLIAAYLMGAHLTSAHLDGADLRDAHLDGAHLGTAHLTRAILTRADLTDADLTDADLTDADLTDADLTRAHLTRADLTDADLTDAILTDADLDGALWPAGVQAPEGWAVDSDSGRLKRAGQLSEVMRITSDNSHFFCELAPMRTNGATSLAATP